MSRAKLIAECTEGEIDGLLGLMDACGRVEDQVLRIRAMLVRGKLPNPDLVELVETAVGTLTANYDLVNTARELRGQLQEGDDVR